MNKTELITVLVPFTHDELTALKDAHIDKLVEQSNLLEKHAAEKKRMKAEQEQMKAEIFEMLNAIRTKGENRQVLCELSPNYVDGVMEYVNTHTGEIVRTRKLLPSEKQLSIHVDAPNTVNDRFSRSA